MAVSLTELDAINICLRAVGESPVTSTDSKNPYVIAAKNIIDDKNKDIQSQGWYYNTQRSLRLPVDINGFIYVPLNTLAINTSDEAGAIAIRGDKLFDLYNNTNIFSAPMVLDLVESVEFRDIPYVAAKYIAYSSAEEMQSSYEVDQLKVQILSQKVQLAGIEMKKVERRNRNSNSLNAPQSSVLGSLTGGRGTQRNPSFIGG